MLSTLLFRYRPIGVAEPKLLDDLNSAIRKMMMREGQALIAATREGGRCYLKFTLLNPDTTLMDIQAVLDLVRRYGQGCLEARSCEPEVLLPLAGAN
jgi:L-2,4-diaminobutyrate decarboxylase